MSDSNNTRLGIVLMCATTFVFAVQDGISRYLAEEHNVVMIVMIRYWFFAAFVLVLARRHGEISKVAKTNQIVLQIFRGVLLVAEICVMVAAFVLLGLVESHAIFTSYPLIIAALSGPILREHVGWRRWIAIFVGFVGVLIILQPGSRVFATEALVPLCSSLMFALYGLLTRYVARKDSAMTSFFWTGIAGAIAITPFGLSQLEPMSQTNMLWMGVLCITGALGHWLLIKTYEVAEASAVQPFAYLQLVFASVIGIAVFSERLEINVMIGASLVIAAGLFTLFRSRQSG